MRILSIVGTRPQYVKLAPLLAASKNKGITHDWIDTGQHYSANMSQTFLEEFMIPNPKINLEVGSGSHGVQTARMILGIEEYLLNNTYEMVVVYGDTNSTLAGAIAATKLGIPVAHVESGLRSRNQKMAEELNRKMVDHVASILFAPTALAFQNLLNEGLSNVINSGDVMFDVLLKDLSDNIKPKNTSDFLLCTIHRAETTDSPERLRTIFGALEASSFQVIIPAHPRLRAKLQEFQIQPNPERITLIEPLEHSAMLRKILESKCVVTDSGGIQKEAYMLKKICVTVREETEWPETLVGGWNFLSPNLNNLNELASRKSPVVTGNYFGDGNAAIKILDEIKKYISNAQKK